MQTSSQTQAESSRLSAALKYASQGRMVFALAADAKVPRKGSAGFQEATNDSETIRQWWTSATDANVAIATGKVSEVFVVDLDVDEDTTWSLT